MKLIDKYKDTYANITTYIYELPNKLKIVHSLNKNSIDYNFSIVIKAGAYYEHEQNLLRGTTHMLEHVLAGNPNYLFKTKHEMDKYEFGTPTKASFNSNATTTNKFLFFYAHGNFNASLRITKYITAQINYPLDNIKKYIQKEREIILAEKARRPKDEKWPDLIYKKFMFGKVYPEFIKDVLGSVEDIKQINIDDLKKSYKSILHPENIVVTIQSSKPLNKKVISVIEELNNVLNYSKKKLKEDIRSLNNSFEFIHFKDEHLREVSFSILYPFQNERFTYKEINYKKMILTSILLKLFWKIGQVYLREEKKLIYGVELINNFELFNYRIIGIKLTCNFDKFEEVLNETYYCIYSYLKKYLKTQNAIQWFDGQISNFLFKRSYKFNINYAESIGVDILESYNYKWDYKKALEQAKKLEIKDLVNFSKDFLKIKPKIWLTSAYDDEIINKIVENSDFKK